MNTPSKAFECRFRGGDWYVMTSGHISARQAAGVFAQRMIEDEWKKYDMVVARKLASVPVEVRYGEDGEIHEYEIVNMGLTMNVVVEHV